MIKVNYDSTTSEIKGYYPDDIAYKSIPEPCIEIDEATHLDCINNPGKRKVDIDTKKVIECTPTVQTTTEATAYVDETTLSIMEAIADLAERTAELESAKTEGSTTA